MTRIGLLSDTHGFLDTKIADYVSDCDELWHAGDVGNTTVIETLQAWKPTHGVYGNIDGQAVRGYFPEHLLLEREGLRILMIHIGGYPGRYSPRSRALIEELKPDVFVCGHSHILKVIKDQKRNMWCLNPGACGKHGFHKVRTFLRFGLHQGQLKDMEAIELGKRGAI